MTNQIKATIAANKKRLIDLTNQRFGLLLVLKRGPSDYAGNSRWYCMCDCGKSKLVWAQTLKSGITINCGCSRRPYKKRKSNVKE